MRSTSLFSFLLGILLPSFPTTTASPAANNLDTRAPPLPVYTTLDSPFYLTTPGKFNVDLRFNKFLDGSVPILSTTPLSRLPQFKLLDGNLTTADEKALGIYGPNLEIFPPFLLALRFTKDPLFADARFKVVTEKSKGGRRFLKLVAVNGREFLN